VAAGLHCAVHMYVCACREAKAAELRAAESAGDADTVAQLKPVILALKTEQVRGEGGREGGCKTSTIHLNRLETSCRGGLPAELLYE
jgi:hypothetical protein